jgi:hypothetical protein
MKLITTLLASLALVASATAGTTYSSKSAKAVVPPPAPVGCDCFGPGFALGIFGSGILPDEDSADDALGGGVLGEYFFNEFIGVQGSYGLYATDSEHHEFDAALVLRYPITSICVAPYVMGGAGYGANSDENWNWFAGAGIEARLSSVNCLGIFADGAYHWGDDDSADFTIVRIGLKFPL